MFKTNNPRCYVAIACVVVLAIFILNAWVADDAFITFRVVDNAVNGYGLRWNIDERVQVYTHPLWMLAHIPLYALFGHIFLVTITLSLLCTFAALAALLKCMPLPPLSQLVLIMLPFALSKTLHDHMVSGLESPMVLCLMALFWHSLLHRPERIGRLVFIASLAILTRLDTAIMLVLPLLWALGKQNGHGRLRAMLFTWPLPLWFAFSLFYYGFLFPNTKYAKLNTGISLRDYMGQGAYYVRDFIHYDAFSCLLVATALLWLCGSILNKSSKQHTDLATLNAFSILGILAYVMCVGGDFMAGRFLVAPVFLSVLLWMQLGQGLSPRKLKILAAIMLGVSAMQHLLEVPRTIPEIIAHNGIADEREYYKDTNTLFLEGSWLPRSHIIPSIRDLCNQIPKLGVVAYGSTGICGFVAGPNITIVDWNGLSDPLIARLPIPDPKLWRIGHFERVIPAGYLHARQTGDTSAMPEGLRQYYEALRLITTAPLWDKNRLKAIADFNRGMYEPFRQEFINHVSFEKPPMVSVQEAVAAYFKNTEYTHDNEGTRLFGHDFLHTLLRTRLNSDRAEEIVAIYQAVLLGDSRVSTRSDKDWKDYGPPPTLQEIRTITIPGARKFVDDTVEKLKREHNFDNATLKKLSERHPLTEDYVAIHYAQALKLRENVLERFGRSLGQISIAELGAIDFDVFQSLMLNMTQQGTKNTTTSSPSAPR